MNRLGTGMAAIWVVVLVCIVSPSAAYAYVDPGSGSVIVTTILGLVAAIGYTFRKYFYKLRKMILGENKDDNDQQ